MIHDTFLTNKHCPKKGVSILINIVFVVRPRQILLRIKAQKPQHTSFFMLFIFFCFSTLFSF